MSDRLLNLLKFRPAIIPQRGNMREAREHIDFGKCQRGLADAFGLGGNGGPQFGKESALDLDNLFLRVENLRLIFLQLRSGEALGIDQRLLALIVGGRVMQVGFRNLNVVAEDGIELHFERADAGALALAQFDLGRYCFELRLRSRSSSRSLSTPLAMTPPSLR